MSARSSWRSIDPARATVRRHCSCCGTESAVVAERRERNWYVVLLLLPLQRAGRRPPLGALHCMYSANFPSSSFFRFQGRSQDLQGARRISRTVLPGTKSGAGRGLIQPNAPSVYTHPAFIPRGKYGGPW